MDTQARNLDQRDFELYTINQENVKLREKIEILETFGPTLRREKNEPTHSFHVGQELLASPGTHSTNVDKLYKELVTLRQNNRVLETRVRTLEKQNVEITRSLEYVGNNEPARPLVKEIPLRNIKKNVRY